MLAAMLKHEEILKQIVLFMIKETNALFVTPEDDEMYKYDNEDQFVSITLDNKKSFNLL
jgi:hypothetical protein